MFYIYRFVIQFIFAWYSKIQFQYDIIVIVRWIRKLPFCPSVSWSLKVWGGNVSKQVVQGWYPVEYILLWQGRGAKPRPLDRSASSLTTTPLSQEGRRHEFHNGGVQNSDFASEASEKNFFSPPNSYKLGYTMLIMHNYAVNRKFKCLQYQFAIFGYRERDAPSIEEIFAMSDD